MKPLPLVLGLFIAGCGAPSAPPTTNAEPPTFLRTDAPAEAVDPVTPVEFPGKVPEAKELAYPADLPGAVDEGARPRGDGSIVVRFANADTGAPVATKATLWRLGVAADDDFAAGDHVDRVLEFPAGAALVADLEPGRYRFECNAQRVKSPDPPEFVVGTKVRAIELRVRPPRTFRAKLVVFDETGARVTRGRLGVAPCSHHADVRTIPAWATPRLALDGRKVEGSGRLIACGAGPNGSDLKERTAIDGAFDLGEFAEDTRGAGRDEDCTFVAENGGKTGFILTTRDVAAAEVTWIGLVVPEEKILARVVKPDGTPVGRTEFLYAWTHGGAAPSKTPIDPDVWKTLTCSANVQVKDHGWLEFKWSVATADAPHVLPAKSSK